jgi:centrosomal protein CEP120
MWRRAEEAKFKAFLKQREIEKIEELTTTWKGKEQQRESTFSDSLRSLEQLENKLRQNALDLQKREERIIQLEEELKHKITEVSR